VVGVIRRGRNGRRRGTPYRKFHNIPTVVDGIKFDSRAEATRYAELKTMLRAGAIRDLDCHTPHPILVNGKKVCTYVDDFSYTLSDTGVRITEDVKSPASKTPLYRMKKKLLYITQGISIMEIMNIKPKRRKR